jgi:hypothetical protein
MKIMVYNYSALDMHEVQRAVRAVNLQLAIDFGPAWSLDVRCELAEAVQGMETDRLTRVLQGDGALIIQDNPNLPGALGWHDVSDLGTPIGFVFTELARTLGEHWSTTFSHEVLEMAADPHVNLLAMGPHPNPAESGRLVAHWYEACDAVQGESYRIDGVEVSDFVMPHYFTQGEEPLRRCAFISDVQSFKIAQDGYAGFYDPQTGSHDTFNQRSRRALFALAMKAHYPTRRKIRLVQ